MSNEPKKGFFSFLKKDKTSEVEPEKKEKQGFFSRFKRNKGAEEEDADWQSQASQEIAEESRQDAQPSFPFSEPEPLSPTSAPEPLRPADPTPSAAAPKAAPAPESLAVPKTAVPPQPVESRPIEHVQVADSPSATLPEEEAEKPKKSRFAFLDKLKAGLQKTRASLGKKIGNLFLATKTIDEDLLEELEELLIGADIGVQTCNEILVKIRKEVSRKTLKNGEQLKDHIKAELKAILDGIPNRGFDLERNPTILLIVGVNGVGKTTTIGKLAHHFQGLEKSVLICAADTFRAAAKEQLEVWSQRAKVEIVLKENATDPAAVVFDALERAKSGGFDVLMIDTAGRLHNNPNLMNELDKIRRIISRNYPEAPHHTLLILDAVTGQNGLQQAKQFVAKVGVSDLVITKLDGTAKGGIAVAIAKELNLPIQFIGVGEKMDDLLPFESQNFVASMFED